MEISNETPANKENQQQTQSEDNNVHQSIANVEKNEGKGQQQNQLMARIKELKKIAVDLKKQLFEEKKEDVDRAIIMQAQLQKQKFKQMSQMQRIVDVITHQSFQNSVKQDQFKGQISDTEQPCLREFQDSPFTNSANQQTILENQKKPRGETPHSQERLENNQLIPCKQCEENENSRLKEENAQLIAEIAKLKQSTAQLQTEKDNTVLDSQLKAILFQTSRVFSQYQQVQVVQSDQIQIESISGEEALVTIEDNSLILYYNQNKKNDNQHTQMSKEFSTNNNVNLSPILIQEQTDLKLNLQQENQSRSIPTNIMTNHPINNLENIRIVPFSIMELQSLDYQKLTMKLNFMTGVSVKIQFNSSESLRLFDSLLYIQRIRSCISHRRPFFNHPDLPKVQGIITRVVKSNYSTQQANYSCIQSFQDGPNDQTITRWSAPQDKKSSSIVKSLHKMSLPEKLDLSITETEDKSHIRFSNRVNDEQDKSNSFHQGFIKQPKSALASKISKSKSPPILERYVQEFDSSQYQSALTPQMSFGKPQNFISPPQQKTSIGKTTATRTPSPSGQTSNTQLNESKISNKTNKQNEASKNYNYSDNNKNTNKSLILNSSQWPDIVPQWPPCPIISIKKNINPVSSAAETLTEKEIIPEKINIEQREASVKYLKQGIVMVKYSKHGLKPHEKIVQLSQNEKNIIWQPPDKHQKNPKNIALRDISEISLGRSSIGFQKFKKLETRYSENRSFCIACSNGRLLELEANSMDTRNKFIKNLELILQQEFSSTYTPKYLQLDTSTVIQISDSE